jgi:catechol 2,3-dioxygenase-like lactoylglutathione lyase family enzyme
MATGIDHLLDQYERGGITRRQLVTGLLLLTIASDARAQTSGRGARELSATPIAPCRSINHAAFDVSDIDRSVHFYQTVLGATERARSSPTHVTMTLPNSTKAVGSFISLSKRERGAPGTYNHVAFGVEWNRSRTPESIAAAIRKAFPEVKAPELGPESKFGNRRVEMMIFDPDGLPLQPIGVNDDGWECPGITPSSCA